MKPLRLSMRAFGPFAASQSIDFTMLGADSLFLIHGPTGSGKSSILDAICIALFGTSSGDERRAADMRSQHALADCPTEIEFEFMLGTNTYRVFRAPEQPRPSPRARQGQVIERPKALLACWRDSAWDAMAARPADVDAAVMRLLGLDAAQFRQVLMLPQGQFRRVLSADSAERERILETLFATDACRDLQDALQRRALMLRDSFADARREIDILLEQRALDSIESLAHEIARQSEQANRLADDLEQATRHEASAAAARSAAQTLAARFAERDAAHAALVGLESRLASIAGMRARRDAARRAIEIDGTCQRLLAARTRAERARQSLSAARSAEQQSLAVLRDCASRRQLLGQAQTEIDQLGTQAQQLRGLRARLELLEQAEQSEKRARAQLDASLAALAAIDQTHQRLESELRETSEQAAQLESIASSLLERERRCEEIRRALAAEAALRESLAALEQAGIEEQQAQIQWRAAGAKRDAVQRAYRIELEHWQAARAAAIAATLADGQPCPVCGSLEHPVPAIGAGSGQTGDAALESAEAEMTAAREAETVAANRLAQVRARLAAENSRVDERRERVGTHDSVPIEVAQRALQEARDARARADLLGESVRAMSTSLAQLAHRRLAQARSLEQDRVSHATVAATLAERAADFPAKWRDAALLEHELLTAEASISRNREELGRCDADLRAAERSHAACGARVEQLSEALEAAERELADLERLFADAREQAGFESEALFTAARLAGDELAALDRELAGFDAAIAAARERGERAAAALDGAVEPALDAIESEHARARARLDDLLANRRESDLRLATDLKLQQRLTVGAQHAAQIEQLYARVGGLADLAGGRNERRLTFQRFVLGALLDDVLRQASERLRAMSRGRYWLRRVHEVGDLRRAQGLDIEVFDDYTGRARPVATLSGGEGFLAALSLALGLSDVVQAHAGGIRLDTLFVDEGFGSLDPESLDMAMRALQDLRAQGRTVGIISHVDELRRQIGVGIELIPSASGSRIRCHGPIP